MQLKDYLKKRGVTQASVARHLGIQRQTFNYYLKQNNLPARYLKPLANFLGVKVEELLELLK
jgi:transcriptional regulator with XRE-family HTH domain